MKKYLLLSAILLLPVIGSGEPQTPQQEKTVIICTGKYSKRYHSKICKGMRNCKGDTKKVSLSEAKAAGLTPCGYCY